MAKHLDSGHHLDKKEKQMRFKLPPKLYHWKMPERRVFCYKRELSKAELILITGTVGNYAMEEDRRPAR